MEAFKASWRNVSPWLVISAALMLGACAGVHAPGDVPLAAINLFSRSKPAPDYVTMAQLAKVQPGMTRLRVRSLLGEPLLANPAQSDHYGYVVRMDDGTAAQARFASYDLTFQRDRVTQITPLIP